MHQFLKRVLMSLKPVAFKKDIMHTNVSVQPGKAPVLRASLKKKVKLYFSDSESDDGKEMPIPYLKGSSSSESYSDEELNPSIKPTQVRKGFKRPLPANKGNLNPNNMRRSNTVIPRGSTLTNKFLPYPPSAIKLPAPPSKEEKRNKPVYIRKMRKNGDENVTNLVTPQKKISPMRSKSIPDNLYSYSEDEQSYNTSDDYYSSDEESKSQKENPTISPRKTESSKSSPNNVIQRNRINNRNYYLSPNNIINNADSSSSKSSPSDSSEKSNRSNRSSSTNVIKRKNLHSGSNESSPSNSTKKIDFDSSSNKSPTNNSSISDLNIDSAHNDNQANNENICNNNNDSITTNNINQFSTILKQGINNEPNANLQTPSSPLSNGSQTTDAAFEPPQSVCYFMERKIVSKFTKNKLSMTLTRGCYSVISQVLDARDESFKIMYDGKPYTILMESSQCSFSLRRGESYGDEVFSILYNTTKNAIRPKNCVLRFFIKVDGLPNRIQSFQPEFNSDGEAQISFGHRQVIPSVKNMKFLDENQKEILAVMKIGKDQLCIEALSSFPEEIIFVIGVAAFLNHSK